jgi:N utilization substance protein B
MTQRRCARECALEVLYRLDIGAEDVEKIINEILAKKKFSPQGRKFFLQLVEETQKNMTDIDKTITATLQHWTLSRLSSVDRAIIRVACCELLYFPDTPPKVVINEALEIAKRFSSAESARFVNGILDAVYKKKCG